MDSFYASAEIARKRELAGKPVIVGADPKEGKGRGVVVSCNYEARKFGIFSGMPISRAWKLCPQAVYLKPDFEYYERTSEIVMSIIKSFSKKFEQVSIDEAFVDISKIVTKDEEALTYVRKIKDAIKEKTGLTCSAGIANSKVFAKIASSMKKPDGLTLLPDEKARDIVANMKIDVIPGIGEKTKKVIEELGIKTVKELQKADLDFLKKLGKIGIWLWIAANGLDDEEVTERPTKSLSTEITFDEDVDDFKVVEKSLHNLCNELYKRLVDAGLSFGKVGLKIRFEDFETHISERSLKTYTQDLKVLTDQLSKMLAQYRMQNRKVRLVGVKVSDIKPYSGLQTIIDEWLS